MNEHQNTQDKGDETESIIFSILMLAILPAIGGVVAGAAIYFVHQYEGTEIPNYFYMIMGGLLVMGIFNGLERAIQGICFGVCGALSIYYMPEIAQLF